MFGRRRAAATPVLVRAERTTMPVAPRYACLAPSVQLYLAPDGDVRVCCRNWQSLGNVMHDSLLDLWRGAAHRDLVGRLAVDDYSAGCQQCHGETLVEGRATAYPANFDSFTDAVDAFGDAAGLRWPSRIEFNLSNACNLMCIQCDGLLSSAIRAHRDHLPALPDAYGEQFFADIEHFIPHLTEAQFAGGEPFFARHNFRLWDLVTQLNPELECIVVTNATQWSRRIDEVTSRVRMGYTFSIDAITQPTYEAIRVNARFDVTMANVDRYIAKAKACSMPLEVNFCMMRQNVHEFGDLMLWAEAKGMKVNVSVVRNPPECSLASLSAQELVAVVDGLERDTPRVRPHLGAWNGPTWDTEVARLRRWVDASDDARDSLWWASLAPRTESGFATHGEVVTPTDAARSWVAAVAPGSEVHTLELDDVSGSDGDGDASVVVRCSADAPSLLGLTEHDLVGARAGDLFERVQEVLGSIVSMDAHEVDDDRTDTEMTFAHGAMRATTVPRRRPNGETVGATVLFAVRRDE